MTRFAPGLSAELALTDCVVASRETAKAVKRGDLSGAEAMLAAQAAAPNAIFGEMARRGRSTWASIWADRELYEARAQGAGAVPGDAGNARGDQEFAGGVRAPSQHSRTGRSQYNGGQPHCLASRRGSCASRRLRGGHPPAARAVRARAGARAHGRSRDRANRTIGRLARPEHGKQRMLVLEQRGLSRLATAIRSHNSWRAEQSVLRTRFASARAWGRPLNSLSRRALAAAAISC